MNLKNCINYLNREMSGYSKGSVEVYCLDYPSVYRDFCVEVLCQSNNVMLLDETDFNEDCFSRLTEEVGKCHYDNGVGLNEKENYFEHYDRDQDFFSWFDDMVIDRFEIINNEVYVFLKMTRKELSDTVKNMYDGSSYDHDFH